MNRNTLITEIGEWLIDQALAQPNIVDLFTQPQLFIMSVELVGGHGSSCWNSV